MSSTSNFYNQNASSLAEQYNSTTFEDVHAAGKLFGLMLAIAYWMWEQGLGEMQNG
ncbi:hypothetical protein JCM19052_4292 [Vibrio sp. JCM 19052]|nr:hypothetical protein JCM19052_4292 [Vibrio sp. JCM 19052]